MSDCHDSGSVATLVQPSPTATPGGRRLVAVVGPPNSGKSTLFNRLTGLRQKVANYPGVTVEKRTGLARLSRGQQVQLIDLPGIYSLHPRSEDEQITYDVLTGQGELPKPDAVILILDSTSLHRHLALAGPIIALGIPTMVVLNMADELKARGGEMDTQALAARLGTPVALISARRNQGIEAVQEFLDGTLGVPPPVQLPVLQNVARCHEWATDVGHRSGYRAPAPPIWTRRLDGLFLHPVAGPAIFAFVVLLVFQSIFTAATPLMDGIDALIKGSGQWLASALPDSWFKDLLVDGVWAGVGSVIVFLPQILILFLFIGILEDSGYLARAAVIADRTMSKIGLQGKSFIPLLSAYACAVPAIMATRTIESKRDRIATILIAPFMTCSARLPVYVLVIAAFLPERPLLGSFLGTRAAAMIGLYVLGFVAAVLTAWALKSSVLKSGRRTPFMLEMPPYRLPSVQSLGLRLYDRSVIFLRRAGTVILLTTVVLWCLASVPTQNGAPPPIADSLAGTIGRTIEPVIRPLGFNWKIGIGLIASLAAREVIVGTLGTIYGMENADQDSRSLQEALQQDLTFGGAVALLIFFAFALQCMSTVAIVRRETGGWKWPIIQFSYMLALAYIGALIANQILSI